jgi:hypothetical protein
MKKALQEGDVIKLKTGMKVHALIPEKFVYDNKKMSNALTQHEVTVGRYHSMKPDISADVERLAKSIIDSFDFHLGVKLKRDSALALIAGVIPTPVTSTFILDEGEFVVIRTAMEGGGTAMFHDTYPDGHHVFCKRLNPDGSYNDKGMEINFYQSGCFSGTILPKDIEVERVLVKNFA